MTLSQWTCFGFGVISCLTAGVYFERFDRTAERIHPLNEFDMGFLNSILAIAAFVGAFL